MSSQSESSESLSESEEGLIHLLDFQSKTQTDRNLLLGSLPNRARQKVTKESELPHQIDLSSSLDVQSYSSNNESMSLRNALEQSSISVVHNRKPSKWERQHNAKNKSQ